jgi:predicted RNA-binding protein associated with RNAse of E/G family
VLTYLGGDTSQIETVGGVRVRMIESGKFGDPSTVRDYRSELLGDVYIERIIWGDLSLQQQLPGDGIAGPGFIWFRFWLLSDDQVVERYYDAQGQLVGTQIDVCGPLMCNQDGCRANDLILDIRISPDGGVTVHNEDAFEQAIHSGSLEPALIERAETHVRRLTAAIARGRFPPPLVRNWQVDASRISGALAPNPS